MFDTAPDRVRKETLLFKTPDGAELVGTLYAPARRPFAAVVLNAATGVPQRYYRHFARWLAEERGLACLTYDYRDTGKSLRGPMRAARADMVDWGLTDQLAARRKLAHLFPDAKLWIIGHSLGAMLTPNHRDLRGVARVIGVASGIMHHNDHPWPYRALALTFWFCLGPLATLAVGFLPGRALRFGEDLPASAYWQWRRWCTSRDFYAADVAAGRLPAPEWPHDIPVRVVAFSDDDTVPPLCASRLGQAFGGVEPVVIEPEPGQSIGHLSVFARRNRALWPEVIA
ncbi:MAG: alpha/beta fold hydrolase [Pseudomonadota bacterium]